VKVGVAVEAGSVDMGMIGVDVAMEMPAFPQPVINTPTNIESTAINSILYICGLNFLKLQNMIF
jgi:hypothetical protein